MIVAGLTEEGDMALSVATREMLPIHEVRNPGTDLDLGLVRAAQVNRSAVERRAATLPARRTVKKEWQAAWLLRAITLIDLTTLAGRRHARQRAAAMRQGPPAGRARI